MIVLLRLEERMWFKEPAWSCPFCLHVTFLQPLPSLSRELHAAGGEHEPYSRRNGKPCRGWPPWGIWLGAQTQECRVTVTRTHRPLLSGSLPLLLSPSSSWGCFRWPPVSQAWAGPCQPEVSLSYWGHHVGEADCVVSQGDGAVAALHCSQLLSLVPKLIHCAG